MTMFATSGLERFVILLGMLAVLFSCASSLSAGEDSDGERKVAVLPSKLTENIRKAINDAVPHGEIVKIEKEVEGDDPGQYDVNIRLKDKMYEVEISPDGEILEVKDKATDKEAAFSHHDKKWTDMFHQENCTFSTTGSNRFFILNPGYQLVLQNSSEKLTITVLDETKKIGDVMTRVVEEREKKRGALEEISRNFFAICKEHGDVFYFGEEVDIYKDGRIIKHEGAWRADGADSNPGIIMPGTHCVQDSPSLLPLHSLMAPRSPGILRSRAYQRRGRFRNQSSCS